MRGLIAAFFSAALTAAIAAPGYAADKTKDAGKGKAATEQKAPAAKETKESAGDPVFAVVNGEEIRQSTLDDARALLPQELQAVPPSTLYPALMNQIINSMLIAKEARRQGLHKDERMKRRLKRINDQILERAFLIEHIEKQLTEKALQDSYEKLVKETENQSEVHARHILVKTEEEAKGLIKELGQGGDFAALAKKHSTGPSGSSGGDLGFFRKGQMVPAFSDAAFSMKKGEVSRSPVKTQFGWHVIKVEDRRAAKAPAVEEVREKLMSDLSNKIGNELVEELRGKAKIKILKSGESAVDSGAKKK
ncbi:MAG: peptidylprolyl isomerase [Rhodospirillales bacterium]